MEWFVYMILCSDETLYTGITTDISSRFRQHAKGCGAKYFRSRQPRHIVFLEGGHSRSTATRREISIKKLKRVEKWRLIDSADNEMAVPSI